MKYSGKYTETFDFIGTSPATSIFSGLLFPILLLFTSCGQNATKPLSGVSPVVRILLGETREAEIRTPGNWYISAGSRRGMGSRMLTVGLSGSGMLINDVELNGTDSVEISTPEGFVWNGRKYRGDLRIVPLKDTLAVIDLLDVESYLYGVLPAEVSPLWHTEALKAQAVVSRTYALYEVGLARKSGRYFDLYPDTRSQVYSGPDSESSFTTVAVDSTAGESLRYDGKVIPAFFHASSGGMTESAETVFGTYYPYLTAVSSPFCETWKENRWDIAVPVTELGGLSGCGPSNLPVSASVKSRTASKRIDSVEFILADGSTNRVSGKDLRSFIGGTKMKSTRANLSITNGELRIFGAGYGHGVGMGQWDAQGMALRNYNYRAILAYFYPGTSLDRLW
jgi:stage II sporulation protein D